VDVQMIGNTLACDQYNGQCGWMTKWLDR